MLVCLRRNPDELPQTSSLTKMIFHCLGPVFCSLFHYLSVFSSIIVLILETKTKHLGGNINIIIICPESSIFKMLIGIFTVSKGKESIFGLYSVLGFLGVFFPLAFALKTDIFNTDGIKTGVLFIKGSSVPGVTPHL